MSNVVIGILEIISLLFDQQDKIHPAQRNVLFREDKIQTPYVPESREEYIEIRQKITKLKFAVIFYTHLLFEDDDKISFGEMRELKKLIREKEGFLSKEDHNEMKEIVRSKPSLYNVIEFAKDNYITYSFVLQMIKHFNITTENDKRYKYSLQKLQRRFLVEKEYLH